MFNIPSQRDTSQNNSQVITSHLSERLPRKGHEHKCQQGCGEKGPLVHCRWGCKLMQPCRKKHRGSSKKLKRVQPQDPTIPLLGLYPKKMKTPNQEDSHTPMFIKASFTIVKTRKQAKWPLTEELMKKLGQTDRHTYTQTYDGKILSHKKNEILPAVTTQRPRRYYATRNKADRNKYSMISVIFGI